MISFSLSLSVFLSISSLYFSLLTFYLIFVLKSTKKSEKPNRQRRGKPRSERIADAVDRSKQQQPKQQRATAEDKSKEWEGDSWKTSGKEEKSWQLYRTTIDLWSQEARNHVKDKNGEDKRRYEQESGKSQTNSRQYRDKENKNVEKRGQQSEYKNYKYEEQRAPSRRKLEDEHRRDSSKNKDVDEVYSEDEIQIEEIENYENGVDYQQKRFYEENVEGDMKFDNEKSSSNPTSDSDDDSTIPETGRKVEHIAQKLEQTAQKYAREHTSPKFVERNTRQEFKSLERTREEKPPPYDKYDKSEERERERVISQQRYERERDRYYEKQNQGNQSYERTFEKNPDRNRNGGQRGSSRRFERPRPPSEEAPERPGTANVYQNTRHFSEKEDIYGESGGLEIPVDKDRGYESNFETKLERTKVIERHREAYQKLKDQKLRKPEKEENGFMESSMKNDSNNNTLNSYNRKVGLPRQSTAVGHMIQTGRQLDLELKGPKIVKRTKSFWKFRRDSDVLEGMALWQHRSLVDIPATLKREEKNKSKERTRKQREDGSPDSRNSDGHHSDTTITNEPKPAERMNVPDKADEFEDFPTPAERSKTIERSEYRTQHHPEQDRPYFVGNISRKAIIEKERKRSMEAKRNMIVAELKENSKPNNRDDERRKKTYGDDEDDDGLIQNFTETEASDEESTYSCIVIKDQAVADNKPFLPRTKLRRDSDRERDRNTCGPWYDLWGVDASVAKKKPKKQKQL